MKETPDLIENFDGIALNDGLDLIADLVDELIGLTATNHLVASVAWEYFMVEMMKRYETFPDRFEAFLRKGKDEVVH